MRVPIHWAVLCLAVAALVLPSPAGAFPEKPITCIAPANPGGGWDLTCRSAERVLREEKLVSQPIAVENMPGGSGAVGIAHVVTKRKGDGHLFVAASPALTFTMALKRTPYGYKDITPLAAVAADFGAVVVRKDAPWKTLKELMDAVKANPTAVAFAGGSAPGGQDHVKAAKVVKAAGADPTKMKYVPYQGGGEALASLLGGHTQAFPGDISEIAGQLEGGQIRVLAVLADKRLPGTLKEIPTAKEQGFDATYVVWRGYYAAGGIPKAQADWWVATLAKMVKSPTWQKIAGDNKWFDLWMGGEDFARFLEKDLETSGVLLKELGFLK
ncbi:MAG: tripartite tricarboxylate transporter substrate binding protein [Candidatus Rokubacteria bacterium]|nr:tripartite tricarboxylate transporter substrate binding protein [Candidatus Rokubacteria bacterium]